MAPKKGADWGEFKVPRKRVGGKCPSPWVSSCLLASQVQENIPSAIKEYSYIVIKQKHRSNKKVGQKASRTEESNRSFEE